MTSSPSSPRAYEIRIAGHLEPRWATTFDGMTIAPQQDATTLVRGVLADQAALHGVLHRLRDAGLPLISISPLDIEENSMADIHTRPATRMRAAVYRHFGAPDVVAVVDVDMPVPTANEILIQVRATTVSAADHRARARDVPAGLVIPSSLVLGFVRPRRPVLGMDVAGVVVAVGADVDRFAPGDEVLAMLGSRFGGHAEYAIAAETDAIAAKPGTLGFDEAVSLVFGGITARGYLNQIDLTPGATVLVNGASGAVGTAMVQLAKAAGARVTAVSSAANHALVTALGADRVIDYATEDFASGEASYDVIVDCVGNAPVARVRGRLKPGGAVLLVAAGLRSIIAATSRARRHGIRVVTGPGPYRSDDLQYIVGLAERGALRPTIDRTYPLEQIADAHRYVDGGRKRGSVVVVLTPRSRK